jgi:DNA helicase II / ATP-dependent DNA helicase PcrA
MKAMEVRETREAGGGTPGRVAMKIVASPGGLASAPALTDEVTLKATWKVFLPATARGRAFLTAGARTEAALAATTLPGSTATFAAPTGFSLAGERSTVNLAHVHGGIALGEPLVDGRTFVGTFAVPVRLRRTGACLTLWRTASLRGAIALRRTRATVRLSLTLRRAVPLLPLLGRTVGLLPALLLLLARLGLHDFAGADLIESGAGRIRKVRELFAGDLLADEFLDVTDLTAFFGDHDGEGVTRGLRTPGAADAVHVILRVEGHIEIDDVADLRHIDAASGDVRGDENVVTAVTEAFQGILTLALGAIRMERGDGVPMAGKELRDTVRAMAGAAEDDDGIVIDLVEEGLEQIGLLIVRDGEDGVLDGGGRGAAGADLDDLGLLHGPLDEGIDVRRDGGGEEARLALFGATLKDAADVGQKAHVQHAIRFIQHEVLYLVETDGAAVQIINETSGRGDEDIDTTLEHGGLFAVADPAENHPSTEIREAAEVAKGSLHLGGQFAGGFQHEDARTGGVLIQLGKDGQGKGSRLASAGLGTANHVFSRQNQRNSAQLNGGRFDITHGLDAFHHRAGQTQLCKTHSAPCAKRMTKGSGFIRGKGLTGGKKVDWRALSAHGTSGAGGLNTGIYGDYPHRGNPSLAFVGLAPTLPRAMFDIGSLNPQQREAVRTIHGPVLILAGAGTGKTRVITVRIASMIDRGVNAGNILAVTFTNKAAKEMQERISKLVPTQRARKGEEKAPRPTICTFHSLCVRILRQHIEKLGYKKTFVIYSESEQIGVIKKIMSRLSSKGEKSDPRAILSMLSRFKNGGVDSTLFADESVRALALHVRRQYDTALKACNAVDFDDLILLVLQLFEEHPEALEACRAKYQYVMVDEYQDTNAVQFQLVHHLTKEHRNFCVVGDDDQSIYGWRGAEVANLLNLEQHYPEVKVIKLEQNYRSTNTILEAANAVIKNNVQRRGKQLWSEKGQGEKITIAKYPNDEDEAREIVNQIEFNRMTRQIPWVHHAILFRTNLQSRPIETALRKSGVRYHLIGGQSFFDRREIKDFMAYLKTFLNPHDDMSLLRIANTPARGLSDTTMQRLLEASHERNCSVYAAMRHTDVQDSFLTRIKESILEFLKFIDTIRAPLDSEDTLSLSAWANNFLTETGYLDDLRKSEKDPETAENRVKNIADLVATLDTTPAGTPKPQDRLVEFMEEMTLDTERAEDKEVKGDAVTLITMHSVKGLEYPHVFIVGLEEGLLPHSRSKVEGTLDEERRLFYVAITRAQETLTMSHCDTRKRYGQPMPCHPSSFLKELPANLVEHLSEKAKKPVTVETGKSIFAGIRASLG